MPIKVDLFDPTRSIVRWQFGDTWTVEEYNEAVQKTIEMTPSGPYYVITYGAERTPPNIVTASMGVHRHSRPTYRFSVNIMMSQYVKLLGNIIGELPPARSKIYFADNEAEALKIIDADRAELAAQNQPPFDATQF